MKKLVFAFTLIALIGIIGIVLMAEVNAQPSAAKTAAPQKKKVIPRNLAIFLFDGVQIIDYTGPYEVFGQAHENGEHLFNVYTVGEKPGTITTNMNMTVTPNYTFDNAPKPDIIVLPGGNVGPHRNNPKVIKWVQERANEAEYVMSVCNGAFYLGQAGLLDGLTATTFYGMIDDLKTLAPKAKIVRDQRFVDNGKIITTAGLSSGIDGALHLVEKIAGYGRAQEIALNMEYNWQPDSGYARASLADRYLRKVVGQGFDIPPDAGWKVLDQKGGRDNWEKNWEVRIDSPAPDVLKIIDAKLSEGWSKLNSTNAHGTAKSIWKFTDEDGKTWTAVSSIKLVEGQKSAYKLTITLSRGDSSAQLRD
ncbi:MAG: DJ-1/PfpI family protein [Pyrinomonadaceae bacterium]